MLFEVLVDIPYRRLNMKQIVCVNATDFPEDILDYCVRNEIQTHYQNDVTYIEDDGNPFAEWLKSQGYKFPDNEGGFIAILST